MSQRKNPKVKSQIKIQKKLEFYILICNFDICILIFEFLLVSVFSAVNRVAKCELPIMSGETACP